MRCTCKFILVILVACFLCVFASAQDNGYIIRFNDEQSFEKAMKYMNSRVQFYSDNQETSSLEEVSKPLDMYLTYDKDLADEFEKMGLTMYCEDNQVWYFCDYDYDLNQYYQSYQKNWEHEAVNVQEAWSYGVYGNDVVVAVIDSGVKSTHEDLKNNMLSGFSAVDGDASSEDLLGHGTSVAGVIASQANSVGCVGIAHRAKILPIKVSNEQTFTTANIAYCITKAVESGADVINMSIGFVPTTDNANYRYQAIENAIQYANMLGVIIVAAAGNEGLEMYSYPASFEGVISVANLMKSSGGTYAVASSSNRNDRITIAAPGTLIHTTGINGTTSYVQASGTSFASPCVAAIAALAKSVKPSITHEEFEELLIETADKTYLNGQDRDNFFGYGIADAGKLIRTLIMEEIANQKTDVYVSPIDKTTYGNDTGKVYMNMKITNFSGLPRQITFIGKSMNGLKPIGINSATRTIGSGATTEIDATLVEGALTCQEFSCYFLDTVKLSPVYKKVVNN